jgi:hypothetical protein
MKNIDKIFNESLQHYERQPRTEAWEKLQARLEKKDSKVLPMWWKYASAASVALLLGVGGYWFVNNSSNESQIVATNTTVKAQPTVKSIPEVLNESKSNENAIAKTVDLKQKNLSAVADVSNDIKPHSSVRKHAQLPINSSVAIIKPVDNLPIRKQSDLQNQNNQIIAIETIKIKTPEIKNPIEENTIVLVLENTKSKKEEETIVLNFVDTKVETVAQNIEPEKKQSRVGKIWEQLKRAKNGENVNWGEVGVKPQKVLARADAKIENALTRGESNDK